MADRRRIGIGFLGFGTVGQGVWKHLCRNREVLEQRLGVGVESVRAAVKDLQKKRDVALPEGFLTADGSAVVDDPRVDIVCELMGGIEEARALSLRALKKGKIVVTANKALLSAHGKELFATAQQAGGCCFFEASVAGGIPLIKVLREGLVANRFPLICGILNGTSNYILTRMEREGLPLETIVEEAKALGYVEADESLDLDGWDAAHKAVILTYLAHGKWIQLSQMLVEGIRSITPEDMAYARQLGYKIKLLAIVARDFEKGHLSARVHPTLVPLKEGLARVDGVFNGIHLTGDVVGDTLLVGRGAGQDATASAVIGDIADAVLALTRGGGPSLLGQAEVYEKEGACVLASLEDIPGRYYLRLTVQDEPGALAKVTQVFANGSISLANVTQREQSGTALATLFVVTHRSNERSIAHVVDDLKQLAVVGQVPVLLRLYDW